MDTVLLKTFLMVRELGHFGKTAKNLGITQSAVSLRIKQIEDELDAPLFNRYRNNLQLTDTGERFVLYAEKIISDWENAKLDIELRKQGRKNIRLGVCNGFCSNLLKNCIVAVYENSPGITLKVTTQDEANLRARLREKRMDLILLYEAFRDTDFVSVPVSSIELVLVSSEPGMTLEKMMAGEYVTVEWGSFFNTRFLELSSRMPSPVFQCTESEFALQFILDHGGSAYLPYRLVENHLEDKLHRIESAPVLDQPIYAIYPAASHYRQEIASIIDVLKETARPAFSSLEDVMNAFQPLEESALLTAV